MIFGFWQRNGGFIWFWMVDELFRIIGCERLVFCEYRDAALAFTRCDCLALALQTKNTQTCSSLNLVSLNPLIRLDKFFGHPAETFAMSGP